MRKFALAIFLLANIAAAEEFGDISIVSRPSLPGGTNGTYAEYRFEVSNDGGEPHTIRFDILTRTPYRGMSRTLRTNRTVVAAPRSVMTVALLHRMESSVYGEEIHVEIDGEREEEPLRPAPRSTDDDESQILISRSVQDADLNKALHPNPREQRWSFIRGNIAPSEWSTAWQSYSRYRGILVTAADFAELPPPVQTAIWRWVQAGGSITFAGEPPESLPEIAFPADGAAFRGNIGFGGLNVIPVDAAEVTQPMLIELEQSWGRTALGSSNETTVRERMPLLRTQLPAGTLYGALVIFALAGGPINVWWLARKNRRLWIFWTLPVLSAATAILIIGAVILNEGWLRVQRTTSLTFLDEPRGEAVTLGWLGVYATFPQDGKVRFDPAAELHPAGGLDDSAIDWTDGQRLTAGWFGSRVPTYIAFRKSEPRRERLALRVEGGKVLAVNGLGAPIHALWFMNESGVTYFANTIAPGQQVALAPISAPPTTATGHPAAALFGYPENWLGYRERVTGNVGLYLRPGTYVAELKRSPFVDPALEKPTEARSDAVVIGIAGRRRAS